MLEQDKWVSGADLESRTRRGWTTLMLASSQGDIELVELLLEEGNHHWVQPTPVGQVA